MKSEDQRGYFSTEELVHVFKQLSTRPEIYHLLVRFVRKKVIVNSADDRMTILLGLFRYSRHQDFLSVEDLILFLEAEQGVRFLECKAFH